MVMNRPNQEILILDWLITSHVTLITSSDWLFTCVGWFLVMVNLPVAGLVVVSQSPSP